MSVLAIYKENDDIYKISHVENTGNLIDPICVLYNINDVKYNKIRMRLRNEDLINDDNKLLVNYTQIIIRIGGLLEIKKNEKKELSENSKQRYEVSIKYLKKIMDLDKFDIEKFRELHKNIPNETTKTNLCALIHYYKNNEEIKNIISEELKIVAKKIIELRDNSLSKIEEDNFISWNTVLEIYKKLGQLASNIDDKHTDECHLLLSLYIHISPRRILDYTQLQYIIDFKDVITSNCYVKNDKILFIQKYKTLDSYGKVKIYINDELTKILDNYINKYKLNDKDYIFNNLKSKTVRMLQNIFLSYVNKRISATLLRHIFLTHCYTTGILIKKKERERIAREMSHSVNMQLEYIRYTDKKYDFDVPDIKTLKRAGRPKK